MAEVSFSIFELFNKQFGVKPDKFNFDELPAPDSYSSLGSPLYARDNFGRYYFMPVKMGLDTNSLVYLPYPMMSIEGNKTIISTPLVGRNGTVKELINVRDYKLNIQGLMVSIDGNWPEDQIININSLFNIGDTVIMRSALSDIFLLTKDRNAFDKVVITDIRFPKSKGGYNVRPYEIDLESDQEFSLYEIK